MAIQTQFINTEEVYAAVESVYSDGRHNAQEVVELVAQAVMLTTVKNGGEKKAGWFYYAEANKAFDTVQGIIDDNLAKGLVPTMKAYIAHLNKKGIFLAE